MLLGKKTSHFSMSLSSLDSSAVPCGTHLVGFSCLCFSQSMLFALSPHPPSLSYSLSLFLPVSFRSQAKYTCKVKLFRTDVWLDENPGDVCWELLSFCWRRGHSFLLCSARPGTAVCTIQYQLPYKWIFLYCLSFVFFLYGSALSEKMELKC